MNRTWASASVFSLVFLSSLAWPWSLRGQIVVGQLDDFQNQTTLNWRTGAPDPGPPNVSLNAGPSGAGDHALHLSASGGGGPGSRFVSFNTVQWTGNYLNAGVSSIGMEVNNTGSSSLSLRLAFEGPGGKFSSTSPVTVSAASGWQSVSFPIEAGSFTRVEGVGTFAQTLAGVTRVRVLHSVSPAWKGDAIAATLLVDNITAVPEPEHYGLGLALVCVALAALRKPKRSEASTKFEI